MIGHVRKIKAVRVVEGDKSGEGDKSSKGNKSGKCDGTVYRKAIYPCFPKA